MLPKSLRPFIAPMIAAAAAQFPRECGTCRSPYGDLAEFAGRTEPLGVPAVVHAERLERIGLLFWSRCACGNTMALMCEIQGGPTRKLLALALKAESRACALTIEELLLAVGARIGGRLRRFRPRRAGLSGN